jgi:SH3-like domain-containing protein
VRALTLILLVALCGPALAQTPSVLEHRAPVVQPQPNTHAQKPKPKPRPKPSAKPVPPAPAPPPPPPPAPAAPPAPAPAPAPAPDPTKGAVTGLPIPRFMSLRFDDVNLRVGPGTRYPIDWVYHRRELPLEVIRELDDWRLVQDQDNVRGWVRAQTLSPRRGFVVRGADVTLRAGAQDTAAPVAILKVGVVGHLIACPAGQDWCNAEVGKYRGWLRRAAIYGLYPNEAIAP